MKRILILVATALVAAALVAPTVIGSATAKSPAASGVSDGPEDRAVSDYRLTGTWAYTVQLGAPPGQPTPPPFESTFVYTADGGIVEATSRTGHISAGLGVWRKVGRSKYETKFYKYRFDATGAYVGKTVIRERLVLTSRRTVTSRSSTDIYNAAGELVTHLENTATGKRVGFAG